MSIPRRFTFVVIAILAILAFGSCNSFRYQTASNVCATGSHGNPDRYQPLVCVDVVNGFATPLIEPVHVFPHDKKGGGTAIHWKTASNAADLRVEMKYPDTQTCVKVANGKPQLNCNPNGNLCTAIINPNAVPPGKDCDYKIWIEGQTLPKDPVIIIDPCCT